MKTSFLNKLKQGLFLLIAVLGTFISYAQPTQTTTVGRSKAPNTGALIDIGGQRPAPTLLSCLPYVNFDTGGGNSTTKPPITLPFTLLSKETQCVLVFLDEPSVGNGGRSTRGEYAYSEIDVRNSGGSLNPLNDIEGKGDTGTSSIFHIGRKQKPDPVLIALLDGPDTGGGQTMPTPTKPILAGLGGISVTNSKGIFIPLLI